MRVAITDVVSDDLEPERQVLGDIAQVIALNALHEDELIGQIEGVDALIVYHTVTLRRSLIDRLERCKFILCCGVGFDNVDHAYARQRGIPVANLPDYGTEEVADTTIGMVLCLTRGISYLNSHLRSEHNNGTWSHNEIVPLFRLRGRVLGIIGLGRIGTAVALRAKALGMDIVFYDPHIPDGRDKALGIRRAESLDELLEQSYVLSLHCPLTGETRHMIDRRALAQMPRGSYLVNTARGAVVDTSMIPDAIVSGQLRGAGIDVLETEPPAANDALLSAWRDVQHPAHHRVLINPHTAFYCEEGMSYLRSRGAEICRRALCGLPVRTIIN